MEENSRQADSIMAPETTNEVIETYSGDNGQKIAASQAQAR